MYAKDQYTTKHKADGRDRARHIIRTLLQAKYGIVFFDTNKLIFDHDPLSRYASAAMFLEREFGFVECSSFLFGEIRVYCNIPRTHAVLIHGPLCHASFSKEGVKLEYKVRRAITIAILSNVARLVRGVPPLSNGDDFQNPINAMLSLQTLQNGFHQGLRQCTVFFKDAITVKTTNALLQNNLSRLPINSPVSSNLRRLENTQYGVARAARAAIEDVRVDNHRIVQQGVNVFVGASLGREAQAYRTVISLFVQDGKEFETVRWCQLMKCVADGSRIKSIMMQLRCDNTQNRGNVNARGYTEIEKDVKQLALDQLVESHGPNVETGEPGPPFWIQETAQAQRPVDGTTSNCGTWVIPWRIFGVGGSRPV